MALNSLKTVLLLQRKCYPFKASFSLHCQCMWHQIVHCVDIFTCWKCFKERSGSCSQLKFIYKNYKEIKTKKQINTKNNCNQPSNPKPQPNMLFIQNENTRFSCHTASGAPPPVKSRLGKRLENALYLFHYTMLQYNCTFLQYLPSENLDLSP